MRSRISGGVLVACLAFLSIGGAQTCQGDEDGFEPTGTIYVSMTNATNADVTHGEIRALVGDETGDELYRDVRPFAEWDEHVLGFNAVIGSDVFILGNCWNGDPEGGTALVVGSDYAIVTVDANPVNNHVNLVCDLLPPAGIITASMSSNEAPRWIWAEVEADSGSCGDGAEVTFTATMSFSDSDGSPGPFSLYRTGYIAPPIGWTYDEPALVDANVLPNTTITDTFNHTYSLSDPSIFPVRYWLVDKGPGQFDGVTWTGEPANSGEVARIYLECQAAMLMVHDAYFFGVTSWNDIGGVNANDGALAVRHDWDNLAPEVVGYAAHDGFLPTFSTQMEEIINISDYPSLEFSTSTGFRRTNEIVGGPDDWVFLRVISDSGVLMPIPFVY